MAFVTKRKAVIVDVDGTLVDVTSIRHYVLNKQKNFDKFHQESVNCPAIQSTLDKIDEWIARGYEIIIVTARSWKYYPQTAWWLAEHEVPHSAIYMREIGDHRKDYVVKREILARIRQRFDVVHAIDDNPSVLRLWDEEGIETTRVPGWLEEVA